jgi:ABC-type Mn2+/Zn2+ transport system ATPase subunit
MNQVIGAAGIEAPQRAPEPPPAEVKRLLLADDYEGILQVAREQVESGAHLLDVCVALTERADEAVDKYSGGMKRRVNIAAGLLTSEEIRLRNVPEARTSRPS